MSYISSNTGKARKSHQCRVCGEQIKPGESCVIYRGVEPGEGFYTLHFHQICWDYSRDWEDQDWETFGPGAVSRKEIEIETASQEKDRA